MTFLDRIQQIGQGNPPPQKIRDLIEDYDALVDAIETGEKELTDADEDNVEEIQQQIDELTDKKDDLLNLINQSVENWGKKVEHMRAIGQKNKAKKEQQAAHTTTQAQVQTQPTIQPQTLVDNPPKKQGYGWLLFGALGLVLTLGAINVIQKK